MPIYLLPLDYVSAVGQPGDDDVIGTHDIVNSASTNSVMISRDI